jgi:hypothetical protein
MMQDMDVRRDGLVSGVACLTLLVGWLAACGGDAERATQSARLATLEQEVRQLSDSVAALKSSSRAPAPPAAPAPVPPMPFKIACPRPWLIHAPLGATLWNCRAPTPTSQGMYPQCSVVFQPQIAIETRDYFEFALNASPQLRSVTNFKDKHVKVNGADAFEASFEADPQPIPLKMMGTLMPHGDVTYAITCSAPSASFASYSEAFRQIIGTFAFN